MGFLSSFGSFFSTVRDAVVETAKSAWQTAKEVASNAVAWMAEKAERFVDGVKQAWQTVKPYVEHVRLALRTAAEVVPIPWLSAALTGLDKAIGALTAFENSPIAKKVDAAIKWAIDLAKRWQKKQPQKASEAEHQQTADRLSEEELEMAKRHQETFRFAEREVVPADQRHQLELASAINDFEIAKTDLAKTIDGAPADFEHYLRLRATQKLLNMADKKFRSAKSVDDLSADDLFLVRIASDLIKASPELSKEAAARLDRLLTERHGKKLAPFVFEELVASWAKRAEVLESQWELDNRVCAKESMLLKRLTLAKQMQGALDAEEAKELSQLETDVPAKKQALDDLAQRQRDIQRYVGAAEGFLQLLEKSAEQIEAEDRDYLIEDGPRVGKILIDCAEQEKSFGTLDAEDQRLINNFANAFRKDSKNRMENLLEVTI
jgi:hypothetical protein